MLARSPGTVGLIIRFLFIGPRVCSTLPSDPTSRRRPCASLSLHLHQVVKRTSTSQLSNMHGVQGKRPLQTAGPRQDPGMASPRDCQRLPLSPGPGLRLLLRHQGQGSQTLTELNFGFSAAPSVGRLSRDGSGEPSCTLHWHPFFATVGNPLTHTAFPTIPPRARAGGIRRFRS